MPDEAYFSVDPERLHEQMPYVLELAGAFQALGTGLRNRLGEIGPVWGDDTPGQQFLEQYQQHAQILQAIDGSYEATNSGAQGIDTMARNYRIQDDQVIGAVSSLNKGDDHSTTTPRTVTENP
jgi:hypothetical protein